MFNPTDVTIIFGQRGSGKTTMQKTVSEIYPRIVVIDRLQEHNDGDLVTSSIEVFENFLKSAIKNDLEKFKVIFHFQVGQNEEILQETFSRVVKDCYMWGRITQNNLCLSIEEVHFFATATWCDPWLFESVMTGRHSNLAIVCSSQRPASVHKSLISQAGNVLIGRLYEKRDIEYLVATVGDCAYRASEIEKYKFLHYAPGGGVVQEIPNTL